MKILNKVIIIIVLISGCQFQTKDQKVQSYLLKGNQALASKKYYEASEYFELVLKADDDNIDALNNLGIAYFGLNKQIEAIKHYSLALTIDSLHYDSRYNRFNAYYSDNKLADALTDLSILKKVYPDSAQVSYAFGLAYTKLKDYSKAHQSFDLALEQGWDEVEILINKGNLSFYQGDLTSAKIDIRMALRSDSLQGLAYNSLALIAIEENDLTEALTLINTALRTRVGDARRASSYFFVVAVSLRIHSAAASRSSFTAAAMTPSTGLAASLAPSPVRTRIPRAPAACASCTSSHRSPTTNERARSMSSSRAA